jgi:hypothetical protein
MRYANFHVTWVPAMLSPCRAPRGAAKRLCCAGDHRGEEDRAPTQGGGCSTGEATVEKRIGGGRGGGQRNRRGRSLAALSRARQHAALVSAARGGGILAGGVQARPELHCVVPSRVRQQATLVSTGAGGSRPTACRQGRSYTVSCRRWRVELGCSRGPAGGPRHLHGLADLN